MAAATLLVLLSGSTVVLSTNFRREYYTDISFPCTASDATDCAEARTPTNRAWSLPGGQTLASESDTAVNDKVFLSNESFALSIKRISDEDFGVYVCILVWNDSSVSVVRHGLNLDGPVFDSLNERYKKNAIVGGISAGVVLVLVVLAWAVWYFFCSEKRKRERRLAEDLANGVDRYDTRAYDNVGMEMYTKRYIDESKPPQKRGRRLSGSLAEVNLEPSSHPEWDRYAAGRRNSKIDSYDLDILGSRSSGDPQSSSVKVTRNADSKESIDSTVHAVEIPKNVEVANRRFSRQEFDMPFRREGRRPSLAELVTIYEQSQDIRIPDCGVGVE